MRNASPFEILGVSPDAEPDVYWAAYDALVQKWRSESASGASGSESDQRIAELNWAIDELEARRDLWVQRSLRRVHEAAAPDYGMDRRRLPLLANVFVIVLVAGVGLLAWTALLSDDSDSGNKAAGAQQARNQLPPGPRNVPLQPTTATPALAPIDVEHVKADIRRRKETQATSPLQFLAPKLASLTGSSLPDVVMQWPSGGTCGNFTEVWGYLQGKVTNLSPLDERNGNGFGCGGVDTQDYLNQGREQLATIARTYDPAQFSGGEYLARTVWCWTGTEFITVVAYYETVDRKRLRTEQLNPPARCK